MKESTAEIRAENIRRDEASRIEINDIKRQHVEDLEAFRREYVENLATVRREHNEEVKGLNETVLMLKGAIALVYFIATVTAIISAWSKFGD